MDTIHGTSFEFAGIGILVMGDSGAGKSDLALQMMDRGAALIADDYTEISAVDDQLHMRAPKTTEGLMEIRGIGLVKIENRVATSRLGLLVRLIERTEINRFPEHDYKTFMGQNIAYLQLSIAETSCAAKLAMTCRLLAAGTWPPTSP